MEVERENKRLIEVEKLRVFREERAAQYAKEEEEAMARGDYEEVFVDEFRCEICKKTFKNEGSMDNHLASKKHKQAEAKYKASVQFDSDTEEQIRIEAEEKERILAEEEQKRRDEEEKAKKEAEKSQNSDDESDNHEEEEVDRKAAAKKKKKEKSAEE